MEVLGSLEDDYVWVHDYHLLVLPSLLRKRFHRIKWVLGARVLVVVVFPLKYDVLPAHCCWPRCRASSTTGSNGVHTAPFCLPLTLTFAVPPKHSSVSPASGSFLRRQGHFQPS